MLEAKVIDGHPDNIVVMYRKDFEASLEAAHKESELRLVGVRWGIKDILKQLGGMNRDHLMKYVLIPNKEHLIAINAVLAWSNDSRGKYLFRATVMSKWLEDNLQKITDGGW